ncbi:hypothetical protein N7468_002029 [Penicillium chermesinum]|uniref:Uncharacterized protein n=1 Tax=Penicillium chermesinum TaxID=63820 RepID=A0A9W9PJE5_9EURO|nr:uncharacterized protein N7468_002029 [Penicillium chermesinum]KAJ5247046.1 hypothetical protein N7468_002029 [Penicillium chermesinum]
MSVAPSRSLQASALTFVVLSVGHTVCLLLKQWSLAANQVQRCTNASTNSLGGRDWNADKAFKALKGQRSWACGTVGWYQGSAFFLLTSILHYQWSRNPQALADPLNKTMAGIVNLLLLVSSAWYAKHGIKENAWAVGLSALLQGYAVFKA